MSDSLIRRKKLEDIRNEILRNSSKEERLEQMNIFLEELSKFKDNDFTEEDGMKMIDEKTLYSIFDKAKKYDELLVFAKLPVLCCSFCGKSQNEVTKLIAATDVYICNECVEFCNEIINDKKEEISE
jgi:hypothetical protein